MGRGALRDTPGDRERARQREREREQGHSPHLTQVINLTRLVVSFSHFQARDTKKRFVILFFLPHKSKQDSSAIWHVIPREGGGYHFEFPQSPSSLPHPPVAIFADLSFLSPLHSQSASMNISSHKKNRAQKCRINQNHALGYFPFAPPPIYPIVRQLGPLPARPSCGRRSANRRPSEGPGSPLSSAAIWKTGGGRKSCFSILMIGNMQFFLLLRKGSKSSRHLFCQKFTQYFQFLTQI